MSASAIPQHYSKALLREHANDLRVDIDPNSGPLLLESSLAGLHEAAGDEVDPLLDGLVAGAAGEPRDFRILQPFQIYLEYDLDVRQDDVLWNAADPGWAYGPYHGILGSLAALRRSILPRAGFDPESRWKLLSTCGVTNFAAAPTT